MTKISDYKPRAVGIAWIREEDYNACLAVFEDGNTYSPSWKQWNERAEKAEAELKGQGLIVERVYIDPDTFADWCRANGVNAGREGRGHFATDFVDKKYGRNQS